MSPSTSARCPTADRQPKNIGHNLTMRMSMRRFSLLSTHHRLLKEAGESRRNGGPGDVRLQRDHQAQVAEGRDAGRQPASPSVGNRSRTLWRRSTPTSRSAGQRRAVPTRSERQPLTDYRLTRGHGLVTFRPCQTKSTNCEKPPPIYILRLAGWPTTLRSLRRWKSCESWVRA